MQPPPEDNAAAASAAAAEARRRLLPIGGEQSTATAAARPPRRPASSSRRPPPPPLVLELRIKELRSLVVPSGLVCVAVHERRRTSKKSGGDDEKSTTLAATSPSPVVNGSATVEAWTRLLLPSQSSSSLSANQQQEIFEVELGVWLVKGDGIAGSGVLRGLARGISLVKRAVAPSSASSSPDASSASSSAAAAANLSPPPPSNGTPPVEIFLGRAALDLNGGGSENANGAGTGNNQGASPLPLPPPPIEEARWHTACLELSSEEAAAAAEASSSSRDLSSTSPSSSSLSSRRRSLGERRAGRALEGDDATDISLPPLQEVLHGGRGFVVVEWRLSSLLEPVAGANNSRAASEGGGGGGTTPNPRGRFPTPYLSSSRLQRGRHRTIPPWFGLEVPIAKLKRSLHSYAHGGFLGLAASMMADAEWRAILAAEDPASAARAAPLWAAAMADNSSGFLAANGAAGAGAGAAISASPFAAAAEAANPPSQQENGSRQQQPLPPPPSQRSRLASAAAERALLSALENSPVLCAFGMQRYGCTIPGGGGGGSSRETGDGGGGGGKRSRRESAAGGGRASPSPSLCGGNGGGGNGARPWAVAAAAAARARAGSRAGSPTPPPSPPPGRADGEDEGGPSSPPPLRSSANRNLVELGGGRRSIDLPPPALKKQQQKQQQQQQQVPPASPFRLRDESSSGSEFVPLPPPASLLQARPPTTLGASSSPSQQRQQQLFSLSSGRPIIIRPPSLVDLAAAGREGNGGEASDSDAEGFFPAKIARVLSGAIFSSVSAAAEEAAAAAGAAVVPDIASSSPPVAAAAAAAAAASAAAPRRIGSAGAFRGGRGGTGRLLLVAGEGLVAAAAEAGREVEVFPGVVSGVGIGGGPDAILEEPQDAGGLEWGGTSSSSSSSSSSDDEDEGDEDEGGLLHHSDDDDEEVTGAWPESTSPGAARHRLASHEASGLARLRAAALAANASSNIAFAATASNSGTNNDGNGDGNGKETNASGAAAAASSGFTNPLASEKWRPGQVNRYGYAPCGLEWDCWIDPEAPSDLGGASVDHGTPGALVAQAVATSLPSMGLGQFFAKAAGSRRILRDGISPAAWLTRFGRAVNAAVSGDPRRALPLLSGSGSGNGSSGGAPPPPAEIGFSYRLNVRVTAGRGALFAESAAAAGGAAGAAGILSNRSSAPAAVALSARGAARLYVRLSVRGSTPLPRLRTPPGSARGAGAAENARVSWLGPALSLWPLAAPLAGATLRIEVRRRSSAASGGGDVRLGSAELPLSPALVVRPGEAPPESQWIKLESKGEKKDKKKRERERREKGGGGKQDDSSGDDDEEEEEQGKNNDGDGDGESVAGGEPALNDLRSSEGAPLLGASAGGVCGGGNFARSSSELRQRRRRGSAAANEGDAGESSRLLSQSRSPSPEPLSSSSRQLRRFDEFGVELDEEGGDVVVGGEGEDGEEEVDYGDDGEGEEEEEGGEGGDGRKPSRYYEAQARAATAAAAAEEEEEEVEEGAARAFNNTPPEAASSEVRVWLSLEPVSHLDALVEEAGVERAAAQTCLALLSGKPGGLFLDVKSAYSSAEDVQMFAGALSGLGIHVKGVLSFNKKQLTPRLASRRVPGVLLFHGLSGLELACERGRVQRGDAVLFNGASLVLPHASAGRAARAAAADPSTRTVASGGSLGFLGGLIDPVSVRRYVALCELHGFCGGVYVQEADASAAAVDALVRAVREHAPLFPLGFAFGGVPGLASASLARSGRGFAGQGLVEELQARRVLSRKAARRVRNGEHVGASLTTCIALAHRLLRGTGSGGGGGGGGSLGMYSFSSSSGGLISYSHQTLLLRLMWDTWPPDRLGALVGALGGVPALVSRFWAHYEATSPLTFLELGFNLNRTKDLLRLLRDRGVLADLPLEEKLSLARWLASPDLYGHGITYVLMARGVRAGLHKFAKEGLCCLLESSTQREADAIIVSLGGRGKLMRLLRGNVPLSHSYASRVADVERCHALSPESLAVDGDVLPEAVSAAAHALASARRDPATGLPLYGRNGFLMMMQQPPSSSFSSSPPSLSPSAFFQVYAALPHRRRGSAPCPWECPAVDPCHSRDKSARVKTWRVIRKSLNAVGCAARESALFVATGGLWPLFVSLPRAAAPFFSTAVGLSAAVGAVTLLFLVVVGFAVYHHCKAISAPVRHSASYL